MEITRLRQIQYMFQIAFTLKLDMCFLSMGENSIMAYARPER